MQIRSGYLLGIQTVIGVAGLFLTCCGLVIFVYLAWIEANPVSVGSSHPLVIATGRILYDEFTSKYYRHFVFLPFLVVTKNWRIEATPEMLIMGKNRESF